MATVNANVRLQNPNSFTINSMYNYSKLEYQQKGFKFKYVSEKQLQKAIKRVRQERKKIQDEKKWIQFLEKKHKELTSPIVNQLRNEFAQQQVHRVQTLVSNNMHLNKRSNKSGENIMKCETCGCMKYVNSVQEEQQISTSGQSLSDKAHYFSKVSPQTHVLGTVLEENSENGEHSSIYLFSSSDGHHRNGVQIDNYQQSLFLNSLTMKRLQHLSECIRKIGKSLMAVRNKEPTSDESAERELTRNTEFAARFTRNYLYRIHRQENELEKLLSGGILDFILIEKKISSIYQTVIQAVEVYQRHILKCTSASTFKHLDQIVKIINTILLYVEKLTGNCNFPYRKEIQNDCDYLISQFTNYRKLKSEYKPIGRNVQSAPVRSTEKCSNLLYMYEPKLKPVKWKKSSAALAKNKFGTPQLLKHKKPKPCLLDVDKKTKPCLSSVGIGTTITEDGVSKAESTAKNYSTDNQPQRRCGSQDLLDGRQDNHTRAVSEDQIVTMVELMGHDEDQMAYGGADLNDKISHVTAVTKSRSTQQIWPSNVKLICVTSSSESNESKTKESTSRGLIRKEYVKLENMTRLNVSEHAKTIATSYRKEFMKLSKLPYEVKGNMTDRPWELITSISDQLTNEIVKGICEHLEVDILLQKMFDLEFKE